MAFQNQRGNVMPYNSKFFSVSAAAFGTTYSITGPYNFDSPTTTALAVSMLVHMWVSNSNVSQTLRDINFIMPIFLVLAPALIYSALNGVKPDEMYYRLIFNSTMFVTLFPDVFRNFIQDNREENPAPAAVVHV